MAYYLVGGLLELLPALPRVQACVVLLSGASAASFASQANVPIV